MDWRYVVRSACVRWVAGWWCVWEDVVCQQKKYKLGCKRILRNGVGEGARAVLVMWFVAGVVVGWV